MLPEHKEIIRSYLDFCELRQESQDEESVDLSEQRFLFPAALLPLATYIKSEKKRWTPSKHDDFNRYLMLIMGGHKPSTRGKSYVTIQRVPKDQELLGHLIDRIESICKNGTDLGGRDAFHYMISELLQNIYDHSHCENAFFMVQKFKKRSFVEICIIDDGITIQGSYERAGVCVEDALDALQNALNGLSTKKQKERGFGLGTTTRLVSEGLRSQIFLVSGSGAFLVDNEEKYFFKLEPAQVLQGTMITIRIPFPATKVPKEDFYDYIEG